MFDTKKIIGMAVVILSLVIISTACKNITDLSNGEENNMKKGTEKDFTLIDVNGNSYTLSDNLDKKVYIKFWATWCPICLSGLEDLSILNDENMDDENVQIITIVSPGVKSEMSTEKFKEWFAKQGYAFTALLDEGGDVAKLYGVRGYPTSVFIDQAGWIAETRPGQLDSEEINAILDEIV